MELRRQYDEQETRERAEREASGSALPEDRDAPVDESPAPPIHFNESFANPAVDDVEPPPVDTTLTPQAAAAVASLAKGIADDDEDAIYDRLAEIAQIGPPAREAIGTLLNLIKDRRFGDEASEALVAVGPADLSPLIDALHSTEYPDDDTLLRVLSQIGPDAVAETIRHGSAEFTIGLACWACENIEAMSLERLFQCRTVRKEGTLAEKLEFGLEECVRKQMLSRRQEAAAVAGLLAALKHPDPEVRARAIPILAYYREPECAVSLDAIQGRLSDPEESVRDAASDALR